MLGSIFLSTVYFTCNFFLVILKFSNLVHFFIVQFTLSIVMAGALSLLRPYKKTAHNIIDFLLFFFMGVLSSGYFLPAYMQYNSSLTNVFGLIYLPVLVLVCCLIYQFFKWLCCTVVASSCRRHQPAEEEGRGS